MADEKMDSRDPGYRQFLPWTVLFRAFKVAIDPRKLLLAAGGILVMALGWWVAALLFYNTLSKPDWESGSFSANELRYKQKGMTEEEAKRAAWNDFKVKRRQWNLLHQSAGDRPDYYDAADLANSFEEYLRIKAAVDQARGEHDDLNKAIDRLNRPENKEEQDAKIAQRNQLVADVRAGRRGEYAWLALESTRREKPYGQLRTFPWFENRGPNPYLLVTGRAGHTGAEGSARYVPWERGEFVDWFLTYQMPVLIEPLVKFFRPVLFLLYPSAGIWERLYFLVVIFVTLATWALFGGAITRLAVVEVARNEKIALGEAVRFAVTHYKSYFFASLLPLGFVAGFVVLMMLFGLGHLIPIFAELWSGILWPLVLLAGVAIAVLLVGLVGWPMIHVTISAEGSDSFDALSRSYSYVLQSPWNYVWYSLVAILYGAVVVFFVGFMGSFAVYLAKWGVAQTPGADAFNRDPSYLFVWAPTSFEWRTLLLQGSDAGLVDGTTGQVDARKLEAYKDGFKWWNWVGVTLVSGWLYLMFLMIVGFGYSYFWSASSIIYLLMRRKVDDTEMDEVYLEEEDAADAYAPPPAPAGSFTPAPQMVEAPTLRSSAPAHHPENVTVNAPPPATLPEKAGGNGSTTAGKEGL